MARASWLSVSRRGQLLALALAFVAMFASAPGQSFLIAVFVDDMLAGTGLSRTVFSSLYAGATVFSATLSFLLGRAADRFGERVLWLVVALGLAAACFLASLAAGVVLAFVALSLLRGFGQGSFPLLGTLLVARSFAARRGQAMAAASFGITAATIALPPAVAFLIAAVGWRDAYRIVGLVVALAVVPLAVLVRRPVTPGEAGTVEAEERPYPAAIRRSRRLRIRVPAREALGLLLVFSAPPLVMTAFVFHAVSLLGGRGLSTPEAAAAVSAFGLASAVATLGSGPFADRASTRTLLTLMTAALTAAAALVLAPTVPSSYAGFVALGLAGGLYGVTSGIAWARTYGLRVIGRLQGMSFAAQIASAALGPLPLALSLELTGSYAPGVLLLAGYAALALATAVRWREPVVPDAEGSMPLAI